MSDERKLCRYCGKPVANQHDWDTIPEGEGVVLCWGAETCMSAEEAVDRLHAENARLRELFQQIRFVSYQPDIVRQEIQTLTAQ